MRHVTADTVNQDNETYRRFLDPNGFVLKDGDALVNAFIKTSKNVGSTTTATVLNKLTPESVIYIIGPDIKGAESLTISNHTNGLWPVSGFKVRLLAEEQLIIKKKPLYPYAGLKLFLPEIFDVDFSSVQVPHIYNKPPVLVDVEGDYNGHNIQIMADGARPQVNFKGWGTINGGFSGLRAFEGALAQEISGEISNFYISGTNSEGIYIGVRLNPHAIFKNFRLGDGLIVNAGTEALQIENFGEGCVTEDITIINTATQAISPFQNWQRGTIQYKAGPGSSKVRRIYIQGYGDAVFTAVSDGSRPGDVIEVSDIYATNGDGQFFYANASCNQGARWEFSNIFVGGASKRIGQETQNEIPYAFLADVHPNVTDALVFKSITTDRTLPLTRNPAKYVIEKHYLVDEVPRAKFVNPSFPFGTKVLGYYSKYNEVSQKQFYPVAGQPAKYHQGDIVYWDHDGIRTWHRLTQDQLGSIAGPVGDLIPDPHDTFEQAPDSPLLNVAGFPQAQQSEPTKDEIIMALSTQLQELAVQVADLETKNTELAAAVDAELQKRQAAIQAIKDILIQLEQ